MSHYGYSRIVYSLMTDHPSLNLPKEHGIATSYPDDWMQHYFENNYTDIDPVRQRIYASPLPFFWDELNQQRNLSTKQSTFMNEANEAGVQDGLGISLFGRLGEIAGFGLARDQREKSKDYEALAHIHLLSLYFHETYKHLIKKTPGVHLSNREIEILNWAAEGKADIDIATILNISENTVRFHWKNIFKKLEAYGRVYAITKALRLQIITPTLIKVPYRKR